MTDDVRDRLVRAEQDIKNHKENFLSFKQDDFGSLKKEVHAMRGELNDKVDQLHNLLTDFKESADGRFHSINMMLGRWMGAGAVLIFIGQFIVGKMMAGQ